MIIPPGTDAVILFVIVMGLLLANLVLYDRQEDYTERGE